MNSPYSRRALLGAAGGTARLMAYALLAITLMALDYRGRYVDRVRSLAGQLVEPLVLLVDLPFRGAERFEEFWSRRGELVDRVRTLEREAVERQAALGELADLAIENRTLRSLLDAGRRIDREYLAAELVSIDLDPFAHRILVKRGRGDGVAVGMPVIDDRGVLGQVEDVFAATARVILLTDPDHALPVQALPSGERTIAYGTGQVDRMRLNDLPMNTELEIGDLVVTSGLGGRFPAGLPVGRVVELDRPSGEPFARAGVEPLSAMDRNRLVLILDAEPAPSAVDANAAGVPDPGADGERPASDPDGTTPDEVSATPDAGAAEVDDRAGGGSGNGDPAGDVDGGGP
ncbi:rod shape-determining protein MreC [Halomonas denitrificans]|nr:rod shape-determining protein MreC [Halomonas denitrificans]